MLIYLLTVIVASFFFSDAFIPSLSHPISQLSLQQHQQQSSPRSCLQSSSSDSQSNHTVLSLSDHDLDLLKQMKNRMQTVPVMMSETILLPGETTSFRSNHTKFNSMIDIIELKGLVVIGKDRDSRKTIPYGVTTKILEISSANDDGFTQVCVKGDKIVELTDEPFLDESKSFYYCKIDTQGQSKDPITSMSDGDQKWIEAKRMYDKIPQLLDEWLEAVVEVRLLSRSAANYLKENAGPIPDTFQDRAMWVATFINPSISDLKETEEIRSIMLAATSDFECLKIAWLALIVSLDDMSKLGYKGGRKY